MSESHTAPKDITECAVCWDDIDGTNFVQYKAAEGSSSPFSPPHFWCHSFSQIGSNYGHNTNILLSLTHGMLHHGVPASRMLRITAHSQQFFSLGLKSVFDVNF